MDAVLRWVTEIGAERVELWVTPGNEAAIHLYEQAAFQATGDYQSLPSDPCKEEIRMRR